MSEKQIVFYKVSDDPLAVIAKLCEKLYESSEKVLLLCSDETRLKEIELKLWTYSKLSFIPHGSRFSLPYDTAEMCAVWLSFEIDFMNNPNTLLLEGFHDISESMRDFAKIMEITSVGNTSLKERSEAYKKLGFEKQKIWIQDGKSWKNRDIE